MSGFDHGPAILFCPGDRPERYRKAAERADSVILDLEDAVRADAKGAAREAVVAAGAAGELDPARVIVRVNGADSGEQEADLAAVAQTPFRTIMVPKAEGARQLDAVVAALGPETRVVALCETARGVHAAPEIAAHAHVDALMWGAEDLIASIGGAASRGPGGGYRDVARYARAHVLMSAAAHGKAAIDAVHVDIADLEGLQCEAEDAAASGFRATACIHPNQAETVRAAYRPGEQTIAWARAVLRAAETERGAFKFEGQMIDEPVLRHARSVLERG